MPLYEYHCQECQRDFERMVRFFDADQPQECPDCGGNQTVKRISTFATSGGSAMGNTGQSSNCSSGFGRFT